MGYSGAGKSTLARMLGERYGIQVLHFDRVHWAPGWQERDRGEAHRLVHKFMENPDWVIDGIKQIKNFAAKNNMVIFHWAPRADILLILAGAGKSGPQILLIQS